MQKGMRLWAVKSAIYLAAMSVVLVIASGRWDWAMGWAYVGVTAFSVAASAAILIKKNPGLISERVRMQKGTKKWDYVLAPLVAYSSVFTVLISAFDMRYQWSSPTPLWLSLGALVIVLLGVSFGVWAMASNPFFAATVRIQSERGHVVATGGPYRIIRHPGYLGGIVVCAVLPLMLGSRWAYIPAAIGAAVLLVRTALEDRTLGRELEGYTEYASRTRYRLMPGVW